MRIAQYPALCGSRARLLSLLLVCALAVALLAGCDLPLTGDQHGRATPMPNIPMPLAINLTPLTSCEANDVCDVPYHSCYMDAHWSPDGTYVAILNNCLLGGGRYTRNGLLLVNPLTGARSERISLDDMIIQEAQIPTKCAYPGGYQFEQTPTVNVRQIIWAPDSKQLVIPFGYWNYTPLEQKGVCRRESAGALILDASGKPVKFLLREKESAYGSLRWDLKTGEVAEMDDLPPALAYQWSGGGEFTPSGALSTSIPAPTISAGPIGNPAGGSVISVWQPARIILTKPPRHVSTGYGAYTLYTKFSALSPDGRFLIPDLALYGRFELDGRPELTAADVDELLGPDVFMLPVRDAALQQALLDTPMSVNSAQGSRYSRAFLAWRPDGRLLAMSAPYCYTECAHGSVSVIQTPAAGTDPSGEYAHQFVRLYQSDSGRVALDLTPPNGEADGSLSWEPDGKRLLLLRTTDAFIWNVGALH
jgi:hypothetical protein